MRSDRSKQTLLGYVLMLPALVCLTLFIWFPMIQAGYYSLFRWGLNSKKYIGMNNFNFLFQQDVIFKKVLANTAVYTVFNIIVILVLAMSAALLLQRASKVNRLVRSAVFIPVVVPMAVMGLIWKMLYEPKYGVFNQLLGKLSIGPIPFLFDSWWAMFSVLVVSAWKEFGLFTIILIGGLQSIPGSLYESASIDGASKSRAFAHITLPMLKPILFFVMTMLLINSFKAFDHIWVMTGGGPGNATSVMVTYIFGKIYDSLGLASAASVVLLAIVLLLTLLQYRVMGRENS